MATSFGVFSETSMETVFHKPLAKVKDPRPKLVPNPSALQITPLWLHMLFGVGTYMYAT